jgi:hypothetical protein
VLKTAREGEAFIYVSGSHKNKNKKLTGIEIQCIERCRESEFICIVHMSQKMNPKRRWQRYFVGLVIKERDSRERERKRKPDLVRLWS